MGLESRTLQIAICDDEKMLCTDIEEKLERVSRRINIPMQISVWFSGEGIRDYLSKGNHIDIIFLDIELMKLTGIDVGNYIREVMGDVKTQIVYISSKTSYALQLFKTQPFDFLVKPIHEEQLHAVMTRITRVLKVQNRLFEYQAEREIHEVEFDSILYFKSSLHKIIMVTSDGETEFYGSLKEIGKNAPPQFMAIHKSYLINRDHVRAYRYESVTMKNNDILTISKVFRKEVRETLSHSGKERGD